MSTYSDAQHDDPDTSPRRPTVRATITDLNQHQSASAGYRLGIIRNYTFGLSRIELRPSVPLNE